MIVTNGLTDQIFLKYGVAHKNPSSKCRICRPTKSQFNLGRVSVSKYQTPQTRTTCHLLRCLNPSSIPRLQTPKPLIFTPKPPSILNPPHSQRSNSSTPISSKPASPKTAMPKTTSCLRAYKSKTALIPPQHSNALSASSLNHQTQPL